MVRAYFTATSDSCTKIDFVFSYCAKSLQCLHIYLSRHEPGAQRVAARVRSPAHRTSRVARVSRFALDDC